MTFKILRIWNKNFDKGITIFQLVVGIAMFIFAFKGDNSSVLFGMFIFLMGYFEPYQSRFFIKIKGEDK